MGLGGYAPLPLRLGGSATEGWSPEAHARAAADLVAIKRTLPLVVMTFATANPASPTIHALHGLVGAGSAYFPDSITVTGVGDVTFGWSSGRWVDPYEVSHPFHFRHGHARFHGSTAAFCTVTTEVWRVRVRCFLHSGGAQDGKMTLRVW